MLYSKATKVALTDVDTASSMTLMSADIERIVTGMETGHEVSKLMLAYSSAHSMHRSPWSDTGVCANTSGYRSTHAMSFLSTVDS